MGVVSLIRNRVVTLVRNALVTLNRNQVVSLSGISTPETTLAKIRLIGKTYGTNVNGLLSFAFFSIYRDISEIIHNSYYGARIYLGMQQKDMTSFKNSNEAAEYFGEHQIKLATFILQQINISINALLNILNQKFQLDSTKEIFEKSSIYLLEYAN